MSLSLPFPISHPRTLPRTRTPHSLGSPSSCHKTASLSFVFQVSHSLLPLRGPFHFGRLRSSSVYGLLIGLERARDGEISNLESLDHFGRDSAPLTNEPPRVILPQISWMRHLLIFSHWPLVEIELSGSACPNYAIIFCYLFQLPKVQSFTAGASRCLSLQAPASMVLSITIIITCKTGTRDMAGQREGAISRYSRTIVSLCLPSFRHKRVCFCLVSGKTSLSDSEWGGGTMRRGKNLLHKRWLDAFMPSSGIHIAVLLRGYIYSGCMDCE